MDKVSIRLQGLALSVDAICGLLLDAGVAKHQMDVIVGHFEVVVTLVDKAVGTDEDHGLVTGEVESGGDMRAVGPTLVLSVKRDFSTCLCDARNYVSSGAYHEI